ncbi:F0F1 ATP synthase subunit A [Paremcibacter congregatus]|uniref:F0F1 ATP synthase subunit A n=1 Tax=Paremcibacter congregatus TaxID=2043170 RepID=UPI003A8EF6A8|tara:strand:- start:1814 stop:2512 length:699 start_codon:yes stop_codon:yes gene_type:complete
MQDIAVLFQIGPVGISSTVVLTWIIMLVLTLSSMMVTRRLGESRPGMAQVGLETVVSAIEETISNVMAEKPGLLVPFVGTLWVFIVVSNLVGVLPGLHSPTGDLSLTAALAVLVFFSVHWYGIRVDGLRRYLQHYLKPSPLLFPFHILSEFSRTLALAVRLFGNIASLEMAALLVLIVAGFLVPVPLLMLHVVEALIQAYIFGMLALVYIAGGIQSLHTSRQKLQKKTEKTE